MGHSTNIIDYLGSDVLANRNPAPNIVTACGVVYFATDARQPSIWDSANNKYWDLALKDYIANKPSANVATTAALATNTYNNGTGGVGATITITATGTLTIDGHVTALNDVVLVKDESSGSHNGLYTVTTAGAGGVSAVLTRHIAMDTASQFLGAIVPVEGGTANGYTFWGTGFTAITVGTTSVVFTEMGGSGGGLIIGTSIITGGTTARILYDNAGTLGEYVIGTNLSVSSGTLNAAAASLTVATTTIGGGTTGRVLYDNGGTLGEYILGSNLSNSGGTLNAVGGTITIASTPISGGTNARILYDSSGTVGEYVLGSNLTVSSGTLNVAAGAGGVVSLGGASGALNLTHDLTMTSGTLGLRPGLGEAVFFAGTVDASTMITSLGGTISSGTMTGGSATLEPGMTFKVTVAGTITVDTISSWSVADQMSFNGVSTTWNKFDGLSTEVLSVAGRTGAVTLTTSDISGLNTVASQTLPSNGSLLYLNSGTLTDVSLAGGLSLSAGTLSMIATLGTTTISGGTTGRILYDNAGTVGEYAIGSALTTAGNTLNVSAALVAGNTFLLAMAALSTGTELGAL